MEISKLDLVNNKIVELIEIKRVVARWQLKREKVVFTNGVFDIIHKGHVEYLLRAADQGNRLIVAVNSDESVKSLNKGTTRPLQDEGSKAFVKSFGTKYGFPPSQAAHTVYCQTLLYADACNRAGTFNPCGVGEALEGFEFDGLGNGKTLYRAEDHQCFKDVLVVKGKENPTSEFDLLEIVEVTPAAQVSYAPDHPMFAGGDLGACNPGA